MEKEIYLTFDDGPIPEITPWVLNQLEKHSAKATFFCIGDNVQKNPEIFEQILEQNHAVGNHTFSHLKGWNIETKKYVEDTILAENLFPKNVSQKLFRPPYGKLTGNQSNELQKLGYKIIMWSVLSGDFDQNLSAKQCTKNVIKNCNKGDIIVFHDSIKAFPRLKETLPAVLKHLTEQGYTFKLIG
ncbi:polysaccharide deacetylase family protein [Wenyingzhuangia sp. IMCC45533]